MFNNVYECFISFRHVLSLYKLFSHFFHQLTTRIPLLSFVICSKTLCQDLQQFLQIFNGHVFAQTVTIICDESVNGICSIFNRTSFEVIRQLTCKREWWLEPMKDATANEHQRSKVQEENHKLPTPLNTEQAQQTTTYARRMCVFLSVINTRQSSLRHPVELSRSCHLDSITIMIKLHTKTPVKMLIFML